MGFKHPTEDQSILTPGTLRIRISGARGLRKAFAGEGKSGPYVSAKMSKARLKTDVDMTGAAHPSWNETFIFYLNSDRDRTVSFAVKYRRSSRRASTIGVAKVKLSSLCLSERRRLAIPLKAPASRRSSGELIVTVHFETWDGDGGDDDESEETATTMHAARRDESEADDEPLRAGGEVGSSWPWAWNMLQFGFDTEESGAVDGQGGEIRRVQSSSSAGGESTSESASSESASSSTDQSVQNDLSSVEAHSSSPDGSTTYHSIVSDGSSRSGVEVEIWEPVWGHPSDNKNEDDSSDDNLESEGSILLNTGKKKLRGPAKFHGAYVDSRGWGSGTAEQRNNDRSKYQFLH